MEACCLHRRDTVCIQSCSAAVGHESVFKSQMKQTGRHSVPSIICLCIDLNRVLLVQKGLLLYLLMPVSLPKYQENSGDNRDTAVQVCEYGTKLVHNLILTSFVLKLK